MIVGGLLISWIVIALWYMSHTSLEIQIDDNGVAILSVLGWAIIIAMLILAFVAKGEVVEEVEK
jgi:hypothetical protein